MTYEWTQKPHWGNQKPPASWEAQVINDTLLALEPLTRQQEDEIEKIAVEVTEKFLERVSLISVKNCFSRLHKAIRIVYIKAINGHEPTPGRNDAALYYLDYQIGDRGTKAKTLVRCRYPNLSEPVTSKRLLNQTTEVSKIVSHFSLIS